MRSFSELSKVKQADAPSGSFLIRWRGKQEGPYLESVINSKLASNEISLIHEIFYENRWMSIRDYVNKKEAVLKMLSEQQRQRSKPENATNIRSNGLNIPPQKNHSVAITEPSIIDRRLAKKMISGLAILVSLCAAAWVVNYSFSAIQYNRQGHDVNFKDATKRVWKDIQKREFQAASGNPDPLTYFGNIIEGYMEIDSENADPELIKYVLRRVEAAKAARAVLENVEKELKQSEAGRNDMANIGQLFGQVLGAVLSSQKDSNVSVDSGIQLGQFFGRLAGSAAGEVAIPDDKIRAKYSDALQSAGMAYDQLSRDRSQLGKQLGQKYNINLIDVFN